MSTEERKKGYLKVRGLKIPPKLTQSQPIRGQRRYQRRMEGILEAKMTTTTRKKRKKIWIVKIFILARIKLRPHQKFLEIAVDPEWMRIC